MPYTGAVGSHSQCPGSMGVLCLAPGHLGRGEWEAEASVIRPLSVEPAASLCSGSSSTFKTRLKTFLLNKVHK